MQSSVERPGFGPWRQLTGMERREARWSLFFLSPWILGFILFSLLPLLMSLAYTFTDFNMNRPDAVSFVGLENFRRLAADEVAWRSLTLTAVYVIIWTPVSVIAPLIIATLLHTRYLLMSRFFRVLFYLPTLVPDLAVAYIVYGFFFERGWFYRLFLAPMGAEGDGTFSSFFVLVLVNTSLWGVGNIILILLAAKQGVPHDLYEAARVDGAGPLCTFARITLPQISPVIFYSLVISLISSFQYFAAPFLMGGAGYDPENPWMFYTVYMVRHLTIFQDLSYAATLGWLFVLFVAGMTALVFGTARYWVFYGDE